MPDPDYDPAERKERYERTKQLKGRRQGRGEDTSSGRSSKAPPAPNNQAARAAAAQRVKSLNAKLTQLRAALQAARAKSSPSEKSSDKPSAGEAKLKDKKYNEQYYTKHKNEIANDRKKEGGSAPSTSTPSKPEARGVEEIEAAIRSTLVELKAAVAKLRSL